MKISPKHEEWTEEEYEEEDEEALNSDDLPPAEDYSAIQGRYSMAEALYVACIQKRWVALGDRCQDTR